MMNLDVGGIIQPHHSGEKMGVTEMSEMKFERIISIGFFCGGAMELEKLGLRDKSYPFDWIISDIHSIAELLANDFQDLFDEELLFRNTEYSHIIHHKKYRFDFYHDFDRNLSIESQVKSVESKYRRRIKNFYLSIKKPTLFIRYIQDDEGPFWTQKDNELILRLKKFNQDNRVLLVANRGVTIELEKLPDEVVTVFTVDPDKKDSVARNFITENEQIRDFVRNIQYPFFLKVSNYYVLYVKKLRKKVNGLIGRLLSVLRKIYRLLKGEKLAISKTIKPDLD